MNPALTAAVVVVGALAAALYYVFNEPPRARSHTRSNYYSDTVYNFNFNSYSADNILRPSDRFLRTEDEIKNRKKQRKKVTMLNDKCSICLENLCGDIEILSCNHAYHAKCLEEYSESQRPLDGGELLCPLCRAPIESID